MRKITKLLTLTLAAIGVMAMTVFAGEFIQHSDGRIYYNTGDWAPYTGWHWIMRTDGLARCYYFDDGYLWQNRFTPDGYQLNDAGEWVVNGEAVTKSSFESGMGRETNWNAFGGNYHVRTLYTNDGQTWQYGNEMPIKIETSANGIYVVWEDGQRQWFTSENYQYSFKNSDGALMDVIDENNFRLIDPNGTVCIVGR